MNSCCCSSVRNRRNLSANLSNFHILIKSVHKMKKNLFAFSVGFLLLLALTLVIAAVDLNNNFESGTLSPWIEQSKSVVKWKIENRTSAWEPGNAAPLPSNGTNYLRVNRGSSLAFGVAVLRSQVFTVAPFSRDTTFSFSFWIRSKWPQFTNLEVINNFL